MRKLEIRIGAHVAFLFDPFKTHTGRIRVSHKPMCGNEGLVCSKKQVVWRTRGVPGSVSSYSRLLARMLQYMQKQLDVI